MSSQTKLIKDIFSIYESILENKNVVEAEDVYDNVDFKNIGLGNPSSDNINIALLQDIQTAAKAANVQVDITTAISGHESLPSRHPSGNAVDIAIINGKAVSPSNRKDADKLVAALVSMGYTKNAEGPSNPKSVLTFGFKGHDDHVHVSNMTKSTSQQPTSAGTTSGGTTNDGTTGDGTTGLGTYSTSSAGIEMDPFFVNIGNKLDDLLGISKRLGLDENINRIKDLLK